MPKKILALSSNNFEDTELLSPMYRLIEAGYQVDVAAPKKGEIKGKHGYTANANLAIDEVRSIDEYDLLFLPGGQAPAEVRQVPRALEIAREFDAKRKPVAAICHGPQTLISAGLMKGKRATCYKTVAPELKEAGAKYEDVEVVVDGNYVFSRQPSDIPAFDREMMKLLGITCQTRG